MHPYHIKEFTDERTASKLRSAERRALLAEARASRGGHDDGDPVARGRGFGIPFIKWELRMQPTRPARREGLSGHLES